MVLCRKSLGALSHRMLTLRQKRCKITVQLFLEDLSMREIKNIAVAGFGLIGGSIGKAIAKYTDYTVSAIDIDMQMLAIVKQQGAAHYIGGVELLKSADMLILAMSPNTSIKFLRENIDLLPKGALVTDVCGIKRLLVNECEPLCIHNGLCFIGGHPMAGKEKNGFENSDADLFKNASYILTPTENTDAAAVSFMKELAALIGCKEATVTNSENHDRMIAFTSQLPHVLAGAYVMSECAEHHRGYSAGSFRDVSRVATVDERLWNQLFIENGDLLCKEIGDLIDHLSKYKTAIEQRDFAAVSDLIKTGREIKQRI